MEAVRKRPVILTVICIVGILWSLINFIIVFSPFVRKISEWSPAIFGAIVAVQFISFIGIWHMKRWGVHLYIGAFFAKQIFTILINDFGISATIGVVLSFIFLIFFFIYYRRMAEEL